jgi:signal peptidase I
MQKVVGSSPIIRSSKALETGPFCCDDGRVAGRATGLLAVVLLAGLAAGCGGNGSADSTHVDATICSRDPDKLNPSQVVDCNTGGFTHSATTPPSRAPTDPGCLYRGDCLLPGWFPVETAAMEPTLHCAKPCGSRTLLDRNRVKTVSLVRPPRRFDLVEIPSRALSFHRFVRACAAGNALRVIGLPGEVWEQREGVVYINGKRLSEPYVRWRERRTRSLKDIPSRRTLRRIPSQMYLLMNDNRALVCDSRRNGLAKFKPNAWGKVVLIGNNRGMPTGQALRGH